VLRFLSSLLGNLMIRLALLVLAATLPAVGVLAYLQQDLRDDHRQRMGEEALRQAELFNADLSSVVEGARQLSVAISHMPMVQAGDAACRTRLTELGDELPEYAVLQVVTWDGRIICTSDSDPEQLSAEAKGRLPATIEKGSFYIGIYSPATPSHGAIVPIYLPFTMADGQRAVIMLGLSVDWLAEHLSTLKRPSDSTIGIADRNGTTVARYPEHASFVGKPFPPNVLPFVSAQHAGAAVVTGYDGMGRLIGFVPPAEAPVGLFVSIGMSLPAMMADIDDAARRGTILIAVGTALSFLVALALGHYFVRRPTTALLSTAQRWSSGDLSARAQPHASSASEFGRLSAAFNGMAEALGRQRAEMQELNATLEARVAERTRELTESRNHLQIEMAEREKSDASLRRSHKLQAIGQLAGGVAHDFNNLLTVVDGNAELLRERLHEPRDVRELDAIIRASKRGARLTRQLLTFSRQQTLSPSVIDLSDRLPRLQEMLVGAFRGDIAVSFDVPATIWPIEVDGGELDLALLNIAVNARDAMPNGGRFVVSARNVMLPADATPVDLAGEFVALTLVDSGEGISPENLLKVFEPFFTTKGVGQGTGLGLSQVYGFSKQAGGTATVESELRRGTSITLYLPRREPQAIAPVDGAAEVPTGGSETILVVEDDPEVAAISRTLLQKLGYQTLLAADAHHALEVLASVPAIDLIFSDIMMPGGMSGIELARTVRQRYPHLGILLTTGYGGGAHESVRAGMPLISKPYHLGELSRRVREALLQRGTCVPAKAAGKAHAPL